MNTTLIFHASSFLAMSQLLFMVLFHLLYFRRHRLGWLIALLGLCFIAYMTLRLTGPLPTILSFPLNLAAIAVPALLWVIARYLFVDDRHIHPVFWLLIVLYIGLRAVGLGLYDGSGITLNLFFMVFFYVPQVIMLLLVLHVIYMACRGLKEDLVEPRRRLRVPFAIGMATVTAAILASGFFGLNHALLDSLYFMIVFVLVLFLNLANVRMQQTPQLITLASEQHDEQVQRRPVPTADIESEADRQLIRMINQAMDEGRLYTETGLTIGDMADRLSTQEYRLRRVINQTLHYRNFSQYLNSYRTAEAARLLRDPDSRQLSIYAIALEVGYASLSSFNKAFKDTYGTTPSAYRGRKGQSPEA